MASNLRLWSERVVDHWSGQTQEMRGVPPGSSSGGFVSEGYVWVGARRIQILSEEALGVLGHGMVNAGVSVVLLGSKDGDSRKGSYTIPVSEGHHAGQCFLDVLGIVRCLFG